MNFEIKKKFNDAAMEYDRQRRHLIPCFDEFYAAIVELIETGTDHPEILDIGAGTGLLSDFVFKKFGNADFTLIDISDEMLGIAKKRFEGKGNFKFITADYSDYEFTGRYDVVISALSIHHLDDSNKLKIYKKIYGILDKGGVFINADQAAGSSAFTEKINRKKWLEKIESSPLIRSEKDAAYDRMKLDKMATVEDNLKFLKKCGFQTVDVFYKYYNFCVFYGKK